MSVENGAYPKVLPKEVYNSLESLKKGRKLTLILHSKSVQADGFTLGTIVQVQVKKGNENRGKCSADKTVLGRGRELQIIVVPSRNGKEISAAFEEVRPALPKECSSNTVQEYMDMMDRCIDIEMDEVITIEEGTNEERVNNVEHEANEYKKT